MDSYSTYDKRYQYRDIRGDGMAWDWIRLDCAQITAGWRTRLYHEEEMRGLTMIGLHTRTSVALPIRFARASAMRSCDVN